MMPPLTDPDYIEMRQEMAKHYQVRWNKPTVDALFKTFEDVFERAALTYSAMIDAETAPFLFTEDEKAKGFTIWLQQKALRNK